MVDNVNHPQHYEWLKEEVGVEPIDIASHLSFCRGNAIKYILRAGRKAEAGMSPAEKEVEDLRKAVFYLEHEIKKLNEVSNNNSNDVRPIDSPSGVR